MKRTLPLLLLLVASPLAASITFTNNVRTGPVGVPEFNAAVASNGFEFLVAWTEPRNGGSGVYTARIEANGSVNGPVARAVDPAGSFLDVETHPHGLSLSAGRDGYFLAWLSDAGLTAAITDSYGVVERRVTVAESASATQTLAAWNGNTYLVLSGFATTFSATLLDNNAHVIQTGVRVGDTHGATNVRTALVADDNGFLVVSTKPYDDHTDLYGRRISSTGDTGDWFLIRSVASHVSGLAVVFDGMRDVVVWADEVGLWTIPVDSRSDTPGTSRQWISATPIGLSSAIWAFNRLWVSVSSHYESAYLITIAPDGTVSRAVGLDSAYGGPKLAASSARILSIRTLAKVELLAGSFITPDAAGPDFPVAYHQTPQQNGALATNGETLLAAWDEWVAANRRIYASIIDSTHPDQTREIEVTRGTYDSNPVAAFNGSAYLLVWVRTSVSYQTEIVGRRLSPDGALLGPEINLGTGSQARITSDGSNWMVAWQQRLGSGCPFGNGVKLLAARVSPTGIVLDPGGVAISPGSRYDQSDADVAWSGTQYVVAWSEQCSAYHSPTVTSVSAATLTPDLKTTSASTISGVASTAIGTSVGAPRLTARNDEILVAWNAVGRNAQPPYTTNVINYRLFNGSIASPGGRQRSAALKTEGGRIDATLLGVAHDAGTGRPFILGRIQIPTASAYDGLYRWEIDRAGVATNAGLRFVFAVDEQLMGEPVFVGPRWWMTESRFLPDAGAYRLYAHDFQ